MTVSQADWHYVVTTLRDEKAKRDAGEEYSNTVIFACEACLRCIDHAAGKRQNNLAWWQQDA